MRLEHIAVGVDFSEPSLQAARWVANYFGRGADVVLVHAVDIPPSPRFLGHRFASRDLVLETQREGAESRLAKLIESFPGGRGRCVVRVGRAPEVIEKVAREIDADVIVAGKHGRREWPGRGTGSTAERLSRGCGIPVMLVANPRQAAPARLLVALDDDDVVDWVLGATQMLSERFGATVSAVHVVSNAVLSHVLSMAAVSGDEQLNGAEIQEEFRLDADRWLRRVGAAGLPRDRVDYVAAFGHPAEEILNVANRISADLVIMGSRRPGPLRRAVLGTVAGEVLQRASCPVLIAHEPGD
jgi:universal stress protein E